MFPLATYPLCTRALFRYLLVAGVFINNRSRGVQSVYCGIDIVPVQSVYLLLLCTVVVALPTKEMGYFDESEHYTQEERDKTMRNAMGCLSLGGGGAVFVAPQTKTPRQMYVLEF